MKAIIETGGKQYYVEEGSEIYVEHLDVEEGKEVVFDRVLMVNGVSGHPYLKNIHVVGEILKHGKAKKIIIFKYRPKKDSHKTQGHRQPYTKVKITRIESL
jgi:large subunit ribosomal protein L21